MTPRRPTDEEREAAAAAVEELAEEWTKSGSHRIPAGVRDLQPAADADKARAPLAWVVAALVAGVSIGGVWWQALSAAARADSLEVRVQALESAKAVNASEHGSLGAAVGELKAATSGLAGTVQALQVELARRPR